MRTPRGCPAQALALAGVLLQWVQPSCARSGGIAEMRGEYGFLSEFHGIDEEEARRRVRRMALLFGIREFEFYNAFEGYSKPPDSDKESWRCVCFDTPVSRAILRAYTEESSLSCLQTRWRTPTARCRAVGPQRVRSGERVLHRPQGKRDGCPVAGGARSGHAGCGAPCQPDGPYGSLGPCVRTA
ncbi:unnamed protein product [Prorocentrum cordatum]|uniref:Uncharacterized protein n=1 Tax=Prorocentrum cordatum TaxID=2364126 RepID=A0ABN9UGL6_9DINO|nr:unnamed protein product [Polarella glacialis]